MQHLLCLMSADSLDSNKNLSFPIRCYGPQSKNKNIITYKLTKMYLFEME